MNTGPQRRKRACDTCHERKIQCDRASPDGPCDWCYHHDLLCTFKRKPTYKRQPKAKSKFSVQQSLSQRLEKVEGAILQITFDRKGHGNPQTDARTSTSPHPKKLARQSPGTNTPGTNSPDLYSTSLDILNGSTLEIPYDDFNTLDAWSHDWMPTKFGQVPSQDGFSMASKKDDTPTWLNRQGRTRSHKIILGYLPKDLAPSISSWRFKGSSAELYRLPERNVLNHVLEVFTNSTTQLLYSMLDPVLFEETINLAYQQCEGQPSSTCIQAKACVLAFVSLVGFFNKEKAPQGIDGEVYIIRAYHMIQETIESANILTVQTLVMLHIHEIFSGRLHPAIELHSMACRIIIQLGGHLYTHINSTYPHHTRADRLNCQLRMIFWNCYIFDKSIALRVGQPPVMPIESCDLTLPTFDTFSPLNVFGLESSTGPNPFATRTQFFPSDVLLSHVKARTYQMLYSEEAENKTDAELLCSIRELDAELENWRMLIPPDLRPALSIPGKDHVRIPKPEVSTSNRCVMSHLEYHNLIILIHQASGRCQYLRPSADLQHNWNPGIQSSNNLSLEASRSTLFYLGVTLSNLDKEAFWVASYYPTVAMMALFHNIIAHPSHPHAKQDLELIRSTAGLVRNMPIPKESDRVTEFMEEIDYLVSELTRLASNSIARHAAEEA